ncbi:MAG: TIGR02587 family membrane protein [Proteobacteria bacterium]|nr:MAG: TIGR02587 family membrane protein [Pseudomonadota bacterium]
MNKTITKTSSQEKARKKRCNAQFIVGLGRASAGAVIFSLPLLMTMEMWNLGFYIEPLRRALMIVLSIPLLIGLSHVFGFEETFGWQDDTIDAFVALTVGFFCSAIILYILGVIKGDNSGQELFGKIELQMIPASIGALLAQSQLGSRDRSDGDEDADDNASTEEKTTTYWGEIFLMAVGSLFLSLSIAPTEEVILIAFSITKWQGFQLGVLSLMLMHAFVYVVDFRGSEKPDHPVSRGSIFIRFTVVGYALALLTGFFVLWVFGRTTGMSALEISMITVVLGFPSAVGASAARLII